MQSFSTTVRGTALRTAPKATVAARTSVKAQAAARPHWLPGSKFPAHLENSNLPGNFGYDPLGLGANPERLNYFAESERVHARWAMLGVAGIMAQEIVRPDVFWYTSGADLADEKLPGLLAFELFAMHWVESKRGYDLKTPGSQDQDPIFSSYKLPKHDVGYPGGVFAPFVPGNLEELKVKEIKNGRLAMLAFIGFTMAAQVWGVNPLAALGIHLQDPLGNNIFGIAASSPVDFHAPTCKIPETVNVLGLTIKAGCFLPGLWP